ncbi:MAG: RimK family alpha-L-glutamate ligase [Candidatus Aenigmarchaeota archaeon]|nr:RimK family alpha-L-glutamate ligase [Candidatus Aenigmarchaeota archaeon]
MKLLVLSPKKMSETTKKIVEEAEKLFDQVDIIPINEIIIEAKNNCKLLYKGKEIEKYDYILPRIDSIRAKHGYKIIDYFDYIKAKKPYNSRTILIAHNKFKTIYELKKAGLPTPATWLISSTKAIEDILKKIDFPIVIKLVSSFGGKGITFAETYESAKSVISTLKTLKQEILLEEYIETGGEDIRIFVIGNEIVAMKRIAEKGKLKSNIHAGGKVKAYKPSKEEIDLAIKASNIIGSSICAVDMLIGKDEPKIIEMNINPGISGITKASGINVAQKIAAYAYEQSK